MALDRKDMTMVVVLVAGALLVVLNGTLLSPALPAIMAGFGVDQITVQWLSSGYAMVEAVIIPLNAFFLGRFSTRKLFCGGLIGFAAGSLICALAPVFPVLLLGRATQALFTGIIMPMVFTLILLIFPREKRGQAMGFVSLVIAFAPALGPALSGVIIDHVGWRVLFLLVVALTLVLFAVSMKTLNNFEGLDPVGIDAPSVLLLAAGMLPLLYGLATFASSATPLIPAGLIGAGVVLLGLFARRQLRLESPLLRIDILRSRRFGVSIVLVFILQAALIGTTVLMPLYVQNVLGYSATVSGLVSLPGVTIGAITAVVSGRIFDRFGVRGISLVASASCALGGVLYVAVCGIDAALPIVIVAYIFMSFGVDGLSTPLNTWGFNALDNRFVSHANAISSTFCQVGASFGTAFIIGLTGLGPTVAPEATGVALTFAGHHLAFIGVAALFVVVFLGVVLTVRDKAGDTILAPDDEPSDQSGVRPGHGRDWLVGDIMNTNPYFVFDTATVGEAIQVLADHDSSGLPVIDEARHVMGFLSDGDVVKYLSRMDARASEGRVFVAVADSASVHDRIDQVRDKNVMELATGRVVSVAAEDAAEDAFKTLSERRIKKMPVVDAEGRLVGTISRRNVMRVLAAE